MVSRDHTDPRHRCHRPFGFARGRTAAHPARWPRWLGRWGLPGLFDGEHTYTLQPRPRRRTPDPGEGVPGHPDATAGRAARPGYVAGVRANEPGAPGARRTAQLAPVSAVGLDRRDARAYGAAEPSRRAAIRPAGSAVTR